MNKPHKILALLGTFSACLVASAFSQTTTVPFDTAQQYTNNFNETFDSANTMGWSSSGVISITGSSSTFAVGNALYNPSAATTTNGPTYQTATTEFDLASNGFTRSASSFGLLARAQLDGRAVCAYVRTSSTGVQVTVAYGLFNQTFPTIEGTLYNVNFTDFSFLPTHLTLFQYQTNGVPTFNFGLTNNAGTVRSTGPLFLTGTTAYNGAGEVGFYMAADQISGGSLDNFSITPTVPEPGTWCLCGLASVVGAAGWLRRRQAV